MSSITIYHNPQCSKSRQTLELLLEKGIEPDIILYLDSPPNRSRLEELIGMLGISARDLIRTSEQEYKDLDLAKSHLNDSDLIDAMINTPRLIQRPIVVANGKAAIGRPPEQVLEIL